MLRPTDALWALALTVSVGCTSYAGGPDDAAPATAAPPPRLDLESRVGQEVVVSGVIGEANEHLTDAPPTHRAMNFVDVGPEQLVVYTAEPIDCGHRSPVTVTGPVRKISGRGKGGQQYVAYHVVGERWSCD